MIHYFQLKTVQKTTHYIHTCNYYIYLRFDLNWKIIIVIFVEILLGVEKFSIF